MTAARIICLVIGYAFGLIQTSYIYGKTRGIDIRTKGSGNAGTTNALRTMGTKAGVITMVGDILKCIAAILVTWLLFRNSCPDYTALLKVWTAAGVILGHDFPFYMHFKGGKGIAATAGLVFAFGDWRLIILAVISFFGILFTTHYVSLCSLLVSLEFLIGIIVIGMTSGFGMPRAAVYEMIVLMCAVTALAFWNHRGNIVRLLHGNERKTYLGKKK